MAKAKLCQNSAEVTTDNGEITFIAARNAQNMNGFTYDVKSLQAQNAAGDYNVIGNEATAVSIPLMTDHSSSVKHKVGNIDTAHIENADSVDQVVMHAVFFNTEEAQEVRSRILDNQLSDVSITTDYGTDEEAYDTGNLENSKIVEVSVVYAGAEAKAKILAKNSVEKDEEEQAKTEAQKVADEAQAEADAKAEAEAKEAEAKELADKEAADKLAAEEEAEKERIKLEKESEMAKQPENATADKVADKPMVLNALSKLAQSGAIRGMNRNQVIEAVKNEIVLTDGGDAYVVPDAVFTEILAVTRPTDILDTFKTVPGKRFTLMSEVPSDADLARAGRWSKGELKAIQESDLAAQKLSTQFLYKLQELSYEDMQEDFGDLLLAYIRTELPQKVTEEEERDFIVGDGRVANAPRKITSVVSLDAAAEDTTNVHVVEYDGTGDASAVAALMNGVARINEEGTVYAVMNKASLARLRSVGLTTAAGLPFSNDTVAGAMGVDKIFTREYVAADTAYAYVGNRVVRLGGSGETIEQYDIDYNNQKIEFIRPVGGAATGLASAVKIDLPVALSA